LKDVRATAAPLSTVNVWCTVQGYADQLDLSHIKPHDFRRFVGTQLAKQDIRKAQKALDHKRIDTTAQHYGLKVAKAEISARCGHGFMSNASSSATTLVRY
jgi:integrase